MDESLKSKVAPWELDGCFPEKPLGQEYGYMKGSKPVTCTREELITRCSGLDLPRIVLAWHPESARLVPVESIPFLQEALRTQMKAQLQQNKKVGAFNFIVFGLLAVVNWSHKGYFALFLFSAILSGLWPAIQGFRVLRNFDQVKLPDPSEPGVVPHYAAWVETRSIVFNWVILAAIAILAALQLGFGLGHSVKTAGLVKNDVWNGQWWRLGTAPLLHGGAMHFIFNASALMGLGRLVEVLASRFHFAVVFVLSAICGSVFSLFLLPHSDSVGASGGVLGLIGFLIVLGLRQKSVLPEGFAQSFLMNILLTVVMGIAAYSLIDNAAHLGGLVCGFILGIFIIPRQPGLPLAASPQIKMFGGLSLTALLLFAGFAAFRIVSK